MLKFWIIAVSALLSGLYTMWFMENPFYFNSDIGSGVAFTAAILWPSISWGCLIVGHWKTVNGKRTFTLENR